MASVVANLISVKKRETISPPHSAFIQKVPDAKDIKPNIIPNSTEDLETISAYSDLLYR